MQPMIQIFGRWISMYWLSAGVGIVLAYALALLRARSDRFQSSVKHVFAAMTLAVIGGRAGGILFNAVGHILFFSNRPGFWTMQNWNIILRSGGVLYGGLIVGFFLIFAYVRIMKLDLRDVSDILVPSIALFLVFGRLGCFFAGCCFGRVSAWGVVMHGSTRIPVQLIESALHLYVLIEMLRLRPERERPGILLPAYLAIYAVGRFFIEFLRGDAIRGVFVLSTSQWISLAILLTLAVIYTVIKVKKRMRAAEPLQVNQSIVEARDSAVDKIF